MSVERMVQPERGDCPLCLTQISLGLEEQDSGIFACPRCRSVLIVRNRGNGRLRLSEAPRIGEEWEE